MWSNTPKPKNPNDKAKYEIGDTVRVWRVLKNPIGRILDIIYDPIKQPKYSVRYEYFDGRYFTEDFEASELTLMERYRKVECSCGSNSSRHLDWCNKKTNPNGWQRGFQ